MAQIIYDGNLISPSSFIAVNKTYNNQGGRVVGSKYSITLTCRVFAQRGSPLTTGWYTGAGLPPDQSFATDDLKFKAISDKLEIINDTFKVGNEGKVLQWQDSTTGVPTKCNPRIVAVDIPDPASFYRWVDVADYTITFEADDLIRTGTAESFSVDSDSLEYIENLSESFSLEEDKQGDVTSYVLTRSVQATGRRHYDAAGNVPKEAWERAKDACLLRLANTNRYADFNTQDLSAITGYVDNNSETIDEANGSYSITQTKIFAGQNYIQDITVTTTTGVSNVSVSVDGNIKGLGSTVAARTANADAAFSIPAMYTLATTYSGVASLHSDPLNQTVGRNIHTGNITFSLEFNDRPSTYITGALSENITIDQSSLGSKIAQVFVIGRAAGPVLQDLGTREPTTRTVNIEATMPRVDNLLVSNAPNVSSIISAAAPTGGTSYQQAEVFSWSPSTGSFTFSTSWIIDP